jgi:hypothetical protein
MEILKADGTKETFNEEKLRGSLLRAGADTRAADVVVAHIVRELHEGDTTIKIYKHAHELLMKEAETSVAARYSLRDAILELGPTGFGFEDLLQHLYEARGFKAESGVVVSGVCIEHELDVVAEKGNEKHFVEAKFHNNRTFKTDVKVPLYMRARFDDITAAEPKTTQCECYIVTNTKFTQNAITYAECVGIKLIGWRYPEMGNLEDIVDEVGLHPLTCLTTLSKSNKEKLLNEDVVLCSVLMDEPEHLQQLGLSQEGIESVLEEARNLCIPARKRIQPLS